MKRLILLASIVWLACVAAMAAPGDIKCSGVVVDDQGEPIIGATVSVPGTSIAAATDIDGRFSLEVPKGRISTFLTLDTSRATSRLLLRWVISPLMWRLRCSRTSL